MVDAHRLNELIEISFSLDWSEAAPPAILQKILNHPFYTLLLNLQLYIGQTHPYKAKRTALKHAVHTYIMSKNRIFLPVENKTILYSLSAPDYPQTPLTYLE